MTKLQAYCLQCCKSQKRNISDTWKMLGLTIMRPKCWDHYFEHRCQKKLCVHRQKAKHLCTWHNSVAISSGSYRHLKSRAPTVSHHPIYQIGNNKEKLELRHEDPFSPLNLGALQEHRLVLGESLLLVVPQQHNIHHVQLWWWQCCFKPNAWLSKHRSEVHQMGTPVTDSDLLYVLSLFYEVHSLGKNKREGR